MAPVNHWHVQHGSSDALHSADAGRGTVDRIDGVGAWTGKTETRTEDI